MIKLVIAGKEQIDRKGIKCLLSNDPEMIVLTDFASAEEVIADLRQGAQPDIVISGMRLEGMSGIDFLEKVSKEFPKVKVLFLTTMEGDRVNEALEKGAAGYLLKSVNYEELVFSIHQVTAGKIYVCSDITKEVFAKPAKTISALKSLLSKKEKEVLFLISEGMTNQEIADATFTSRRTVEGHRQNLLQKLGVKNTAALIKMAVSKGLV